MLQYLQQQQSSDNEKRLQQLREKILDNCVSTFDEKFCIFERKNAVLFFSADEYKRRSHQSNVKEISGYGVPVDNQIKFKFGTIKDDDLDEMIIHGLINKIRGYMVDDNTRKLCNISVDFHQDEVTNDDPSNYILYITIWGMDTINTPQNGLSNRKGTEE